MLRLTPRGFHVSKWLKVAKWLSLKPQLYTIILQSSFKKKGRLHPGRLTWFTWKYTPGRGKSASKPSFSGSMLNLQGCTRKSGNPSPKQCTIIMEIPQKYETFAWSLISPIMDDSMTPENTTKSIGSLPGAASIAAVPSRVMSSHLMPWTGYWMTRICWVKGMYGYTLQKLT